MSQTDVITLPKVLGKVPEVVMNLPGLIKGSRMSKITDTTRPLGLGVAFEKVAANNPDGLAVIYRDRRYTYRQFNAWANRIADHLASIGLKKGDTVALDMENRPEFPATLIGCAKLGVCAALINTSQKGKVLTHSFNLVKPKAAIIGQELVEVIQEVRDHLDLKENFFYFADQDTLADPGTAP
ncbi:MAG: AMP-binding protein, partial [Alcanivorax sp.]|nr:AMP-binding protein [Alcanivorax sp.]